MESLQLVAQDLGIPAFDRDRARRSIGLPLRRTIEMGLGLGPEEAPKAVDLYRKRYNEVALDLTHLFPGVTETLDRLRHDYLLAVASSKSCRNQLNRHGGTILLGVQDDGTLQGIESDAVTR